MKSVWAMAALGLGLIGAMEPAVAQGFRERGDFEERGRGRGDVEERGRGRGEFRERDERGRGRERVGFDEREYLRCHPDVRRAVANGQMKSGALHYQVHGRGEGRRLTC